MISGGSGFMHFSFSMVKNIVKSVLIVFLYYVVAVHRNNKILFLDGGRGGGAGGLQ